MDEKERYEIHMYDDCKVDLYDNGVLDKSITDEWELGKLLNQQDARIKELNEKLQDKIADLEAKLADSEKQIKDAREAGNMAVDSWCKNRRKYEAQIAQMQNKSFILYSMLYETLEKQGCDNVASQIDQMTGWTYDKEADWLKRNRNYDQLKQKLAEKDKEISNLNGLIRERDKQIKNLKTNKKRVIEHKNKTKISFVLEQLEKVKKIKLVLVDELQGLQLIKTEKGYSWYPYRWNIYAQNIDDAKKISKKILKEYKKIFKKHGLKVGADNSKVVERQYLDRASKFWLLIAFEEIRLSKKLEKIHKKC